MTFDDIIYWQNDSHVMSSAESSELIILFAINKMSRVVIDSC